MVTAVDIITYIGVPLAVLGVSPILYNFAISFLIRLRLKKKLSNAGVLGDTKVNSRLISGIVELELPIYDLFLEGCPRLSSHLVVKPISKAIEQKLRTKSGSWTRDLSSHPANGVRQYIEGASWSQISFQDWNHKDFVSYNQIRLSKRVAGHVTKAFQRSTELSLPAASISTRDLLSYFLHLSGDKDSQLLHYGKHQSISEAQSTFKIIDSKTLIYGKRKRIVNRVATHAYVKYNLLRSVLQDLWNDVEKHGWPLNDAQPTTATLVTLEIPTYTTEKHMHELESKSPSHNIRFRNCKNLKATYDIPICGALGKNEGFLEGRKNVSWWPNYLGQDQVPTPKEILYCILEQPQFGIAVIHGLNLMEDGMMLSERVRG
ncbi:hypothetical protein VTL71DRAFT_2917 [Oculimacula yallundae]|uniref:Uncharacterized protein n=1 Tax=Oculimacula yallundae TaxID=86028 RepID=A0ABR4C5N0_9HELO